RVHDIDTSIMQQSLGLFETTSTLVDSWDFAKSLAAYLSEMRIIDLFVGDSIVLNYLMIETYVTVID
ncbi:hypothetical protein ACJX0J_016478, partial [Zea mays]